jgi:hypothetical protein
VKKHAVNLTQIRIDGGTQPRTEINAGLVSEYAQSMRDGVNFPPVVLFFDGVDHWLADGFHRYHAAKSADWRDIGAEVYEGTQRDAVLFSVGANAEHGQRRTNSDKRKAVSTLLADYEWGKWSAEEIARRCGVSATLVKDMRTSLAVTASEPQPRTYTTKHGTTATMQTENIGKGDRSREAVDKRRVVLAEMATAGYSIPQIAERIGVGHTVVGKIAKEIGIDLSQARVSSGHQRHDSNRILEHIVMDAENLTADVGLITFSALDRARVGAWLDSLVQSRRSLDSFIRQLTKEQKLHGEAA